MIYLKSILAHAEAKTKTKSFVKHYKTQSAVVMDIDNAQIVHETADDIPFS